MKQITQIDVKNWISERQFTGTIHLIDEDLNETSDFGTYEINDEIEAFLERQDFLKESNRLRGELLTVHRRTQRTIDALEDLRRAFLTVEQHRSSLISQQLQFNSTELIRTIDALRFAVDSEVLEKAIRSFKLVQHYTEKEITTLQHERIERLSS
jgi:hypothetical protein